MKRENVVRVVSGLSMLSSAAAVMAGPDYQQCIASSAVRAEDKLVAATGVSRVSVPNVSETMRDLKQSDLKKVGKRCSAVNEFDAYVCPEGQKAPLC